MNMASLLEVKKNPKIPDIAPGDTVRVSARIVEGGKEGAYYQVGMLSEDSQSCQNEAEECWNELQKGLSAYGYAVKEGRVVKNRCCNCHDL